MFEGKTPPAELEKYQGNEDSNEPEIKQLSLLFLKKSLSSYFKIIYFLVSGQFAPENPPLDNSPPKIRPWKIRPHERKIRPWKIRPRKIRPQNIFIRVENSPLGKFAPRVFQ